MKERTVAEILKDYYDNARDCAPDAFTFNEYKELKARATDPAEVAGLAYALGYERGKAAAVEVMKEAVKGAAE